MNAAAMAKLAARVGRSPLARTAIVTAVSATAVTVTFQDGSTPSALGWVTSTYTPTVGDRVLVVPAQGGAWYVIGKAAALPQLVPDQQASLLPRNNWQGEITLAIPGDVPSPNGWYWTDGVIYGQETDARQGKLPPYAGGAGYVQTYWGLSATCMYWGPLASLVPSGATISQVQLTLLSAYQPNTDLAAPVLWGHAYTPASPPVSQVLDDDYNVITPGLPPSWVAGYGPLRFPRMRTGDQQTITLPSAWVTAWLAGAITGLGLYAETTADGVNFNGAGAFTGIPAGDSNLLTITYSGGTL